MPDFITQTWSWWFSGAMIAGIMFFLLYFGQSFGFSSNLRTICAATGGGKFVKFFDFNWKTQIWNLVFLVGAVIGGFIAQQYLSNGLPVQISESTVQDLNALGISAPVSSQPEEIASTLESWKDKETFGATRTPSLHFTRLNNLTGCASLSSSRVLSSFKSASPIPFGSHPP